MGKSNFDVHKALWRPVSKGDIPLSAGEDVWFSGAMMSAELAHYLPATSGVLCTQDFYPWAHALTVQGYALGEPEATRQFARVLLLLPRARDLRRLRLAQAWQHVREDGVVITAVPNQEGAASTEKDLRALGADVTVQSKHKCRIMIARRAECNTDLLQRWLALDALQPLQPLDIGYMTRPGLFAWDRIDPASALLAAELPTNLRGTVADLGAGWGYLACQVLTKNPDVSHIDLYEADKRALPPAASNLERICSTRANTCTYGTHWHDVTHGLDQSYAHIVSNPPFHQGRADQPELGQAFIRTAAAALERGGSFWMVANRHLPYEHVLQAHFARVETRREDEGFKVIAAWR